MTEDRFNNIILAITMAVVVIGAVIVVASTARGHEVCLSKHEARQLWPRRHIYWYSSDHCWSNRRGPPRGIKVDPLPPEKRAMAKAEAPEDQCCWPPLDTDANGDIAVPPTTFTERWYVFPNVFNFFRLVNPLNWWR